MSLTCTVEGEERFKARPTYFSKVVGESIAAGKRYLDKFETIHERVD